MRLGLLYIIFAATFFQTVAQTTPIDSLTAVLDKHSLSDSATIATMLELSYEYAQIVPDSSYNIAIRALKLARAEKIKILEAWALNRISGYYWIAAKFPDALKTAQESLEIFEEIGDDKGIADCYNVLGNTNAMDNDLERALEYYKKSIDRFKKLGDADAISRGLSNVGRVNYMLGKFDTALYYMEQIKKYVEGSNSIRESIMYNTTGDIYYQLKRPREAIDYYNKGLVIAEMLNAARIITYSTRGLAEAYQILGDIEASNKYALQTLTISEDIGYLENVRNASKILSDNYRLMGDYENAYNFYGKYSVTKDSMFNMDKGREIQKLEENFKINQQQKEIVLLTAEKKIQEQTSSQQQIIMIALILIIALIIALVIVLLKRNKQKLISNKLLTEQKKILEEKNLDINEKRKEIEKQAALLTEANRLKDKLFSVISHDLKSPFNSLLIIIEHLDQKTFSEQELKKFKNSLLGNVKSLSELLNNLLIWSQQQLDGVSIKKETFDLTALISRNVEVFKQSAETKSIQLISEIEGINEVYADINQIDCVIRNLINNAIKFTNKSGSIKIKASKRLHDTLVTVEDTGTGMSKEIQSSLFTADTKTTRMGTDNEGGSGLGLFLCKEFVEKNGGSIGVESEVEKGSEFYFTIPNNNI
uniref:tetratricopeptide repeat-containing sensor histidine kinase n=1 Tax=Fulvivirga sp. TaxID=1931237 RepID=UPI00404A74EB